MEWYIILSIVIIILVMGFILFKWAYSPAKKEVKAREVDFTEEDLLFRKEEEIEEILKNLGGINNIEKIDYAYDKLSLIVLDTNKLNISELNKNKSIKSILEKNKEITIIIGTRAREIAEKYNEKLREKNS